MSIKSISGLFAFLVMTTKTVCVCVWVECGGGGVEISANKPYSVQFFKLFKRLISPTEGKQVAQDII